MKWRLVLAAALMLAGGVQAGTESPVPNPDPEDLADPRLKGMDKKVWQNLLQGYASLRGVAKSVLEDLQSVANFAWAAHKQVEAIERAAQRAQMVFESIKNFDTEMLHPKRHAELIEWTEEEIFQETDNLFYYDVPTIKQRSEELGEERRHIRNRAKGHAKALARLRKRAYEGIKKKILKLEHMNAADSRTLAREFQGADSKAHTLAKSEATRTMGMADGRYDNLETQGAQLASVIKGAADSEGKTDLRQQADLNRVNARNATLLSYQEHDFLGNAVRTNAWMLISRAKILDMAVTNKAAVVAGAIAFSEELERQRQRRGGAR